jgi:hypothetical protein
LIHDLAARRARAIARVQQGRAPAAWVARAREKNFAAAPFFREPILDTRATARSSATSWADHLSTFSVDNDVHSLSKPVLSGHLAMHFALTLKSYALAKP